MTPMVDLGFLLITFFIFTTSLAKPNVTKLVMPAESKGTMPVEKKLLLTILVHKQSAYVYEGSWEDAMAANSLRPSSLHLQTGIGNIIRQKQQKLAAVNQQDNLMIAIKPSVSASYQDIITVLDEMKINDVKRYGILPLSEPEKTYLIARQ